VVSIITARVVRKYIFKKLPKIGGQAKLLAIYIKDIIIWQ
jgi:hypothetical protein